MSPAAKKHPRRAPAPPKRSVTFETDWEPHSEDQRRPLIAPEQIIELTCGRRWGKTDVGESWLTGVHPDGRADLGGAVWVPRSRNIYTAPQRSPNCVEFFDGLLESLRGNIKDRSLTDLWLKLKHNDATFECISLERYENKRGIIYDRLLVDEKGTTPAKAWFNILAPILADPPEFCVRKVMRAGTARGKKHWTYREHLASYGASRGPRGRIAFVSPTWARPGTEQYVEEMRVSLPRNVFRQELGAEFLDEAAGYFQHVAYTGKPAPEREDGAIYAAGVDLAHVHNWTVALVVRARPLPIIPVDIVRFERAPWAITKTRVVEVLRKWQAQSLVDATPGGAPGEVVIEAFKPEWTKMSGFDSREGGGREELLANLAIALENEAALLPGTKTEPHFPVLTSEVDGFGIEILPTGKARACAGVGPDGERLCDDTVIALALAVWRAKNLGGGYASRKTY